MALLVLAALGGNLIQHRLVWSAEALQPKFSKISPAAGFGRHSVNGCQTQITSFVSEGVVRFTELWALDQSEGPN